VNPHDGYFSDWRQKSFGYFLTFDARKPCSPLSLIFSTPWLQRMSDNMMIVFGEGASLSFTDRPSGPSVDPAQLTMPDETTSRCTVPGRGKGRITKVLLYCSTRALGIAGWLSEEFWAGNRENLGSNSRHGRL